MHSDPDAPLVDLVWFRSDLPYLEQETVINSLDWDEEPWRPRLVGEQYGNSRNYNRREEIPGLTGTHVCGTPYEFANGQDWPYHGPPIVYLPNGIPACCAIADVEVVTGGARPASVVLRPYYRTALVTSGSRPASVLVGSETRPALVTSGSRPASVLVGSETRSALVTGGARPASVLTSSSLRTALVTAGARPASVLVGSETRPALVTGGARPASVLTSSSSRTALVTGGARPASVLSTTFFEPAEGGGMFGGSSGDTFTPGSPLPGNSCTSAFFILLGETYGHNFVTDPARDWWKFVAPVTGTYHVTATGFTDPAMTLVVCTTPNCFVISTIVTEVTGPPCWEFSVGAGTAVFFQIFRSSGAGGSYSFVANVGAC